MKGENVCIFDGKYIIRMALVLLFIAIIWLNKISILPKLYFTFRDSIGFQKLSSSSGVLAKSLETNFSNKFSIAILASKICRSTTVVNVLLMKKKMKNQIKICTTAHKMLLESHRHRYITKI